MKKIILLLISFCLHQFFLKAQQGYLDSTFGVNGVVITDVSYSDFAYGLVVQPDKKIIVAGSSFYKASDFSIIRYLNNGSLDSTFSGDGKLLIEVHENTDKCYDVALQNDGKIVLAGFTYNNSDTAFAVVRLHPDGTLDNSFDSDGIVKTDFTQKEDVAQSVAIQSDGKIVVAGFSYNGFHRDFAICRYNSNGSLDNTFGNNGKVLTDFNGNDDRLYSIGIQPNGKIVATGYTINLKTYNANVALARYNSNGSLDSTFGINGKVISDFSQEDVAYALALQPDGKIVLAGKSFGTYGDIAVFRYNSDGSLDNSFGTGGLVKTTVSNSDEFVHAVKIQDDGKIVAAGGAIIGSGAGYEDLVVVRFNSNGTLDNTFGNNGKCVTAVSPKTEELLAMDIQPDGKIVAAGTIETGSMFDIVVARYISGLNVGILDMELLDNSVLIYPNPLTANPTLEYSLLTETSLTIDLKDINGKVIKTFIKDKTQSVGQNRILLDLPLDLPAGVYFITLSSITGSFSIKVTK